MKYFIWTEPLTIKAFEIDSHGRATLSALANHMQHAAGNHAGELGVSVTDLMKNGMSWVLSRMTILVHRLPHYNERVRIETWPSGTDRLLAFRDFELFDGLNQPVLAARTTWIMVDLDRMRPVQMPDFIHDIGRKNKRFSIPKTDERLLRFTNDPLHAFSHDIRLSDIDMNNHVNNVKYLEWVFESVPASVRDQKSIRRMDIVFKAESKYGDRIISQCASGSIENTFHHAVLHAENQRELSLAATQFE